jgi:hypothetical protein
MNNSNTPGYRLGLAVGLICILSIYLISSASFFYLLFYSDNKWQCIIPLTLMFTFSIWRKMHALYNAIEKASKNGVPAKIDPEELRKQVTKLLYETKTYGGPN